MESEYTILGGGVAGLCTAIRLAELGAKPLLIEAGEYPTHRVCGEFFSPESMDILKKWDIYPRKIHHVRFHVGPKTLQYTFPTAAGSLSHITFDQQLIERAPKAKFMTSTKVTSLSLSPSGHILNLSTGNQIHTRNLFIATGRIPPIGPKDERKQIQPIYQGIKAHFEGDLPNDALEMFFLDNSYIGISPIEDGKFNIACLSTQQEFAKWKSPDEFIDHLRSKNQLLNNILQRGKNLFTQWMTAAVPEFGLRDTPNWPHTYFIGDAASSIPPATGNGLTLAIKSGLMAAEFGMQRNYLGFKDQWTTSVRSPIFWGKLLNNAGMRPWTAQLLMQLCDAYPSITDFLFKRTRS